MIRTFKVFALFFALFPSLALAGDGAFLDPPYRDLKHPVFEYGSHSFEAARIITPALRRSSAQRAIRFQTPVKMQASRGTCSIFSAIGLLEAELIARGDFDASADFSEEWLEYVVTRNRSSDGSTSTTNFRAILAYGSVDEVLMPYIGENWKTASSGLAAERCGHLEGGLLASCLIAHRDPRLFKATDTQLSDPESGLFDPEFLQIRSSAREFVREYLPTPSPSGPPSFYLDSVEDVKMELAGGKTITLDIDFYYGAWNHRVATNLAIERNLDHWSRGIIGYPEEGSADRKNSSKDPAGHSVVVVGYDDDAEVTTRVLMADGTYQEFTYRGVYYIKNSWGRENFGAKFELGGVKYPGYGMIVQRYAHEFGAFYAFPLN